MEVKERREKILEMLETAEDPISGGELAKKLSVSRQVIVQDIALLRAVNKNILSTARGYLLYQQKEKKKVRCFQVSHTTEQIEDELTAIVDLGGRVLDVCVMHPIYGSITTDLFIFSRKDAADFVKKIKSQQTVPLKELTNGIHFQTVEADREEVLDAIEKALDEKKYLIRC